MTLIFCLISGFESPVVQLLVFQAAEHPLRRAVVPAVALAAHYTGLGVQFDVGDGDLAEGQLRVEHSGHKLFRRAKIFRGLPGSMLLN